MPKWFRKNLGDASLAGESLEQIKQLFLQTYADQSPTFDKALFYHHLSEGRLHCEIVVYFSPATAEFAAQVAASPCQKPEVFGLSLLVSDRQTIDYKQ
jgi:hypothetical protein